MDKSKISDFITSKGEAEAIEIRNQASKEAKKIELEIISAAQKEADKIINDAKVSADLQIKSLEMSHEIARRQALLLAKSEVMNQVFDAAYQKIKSLSETDFLALVVKLIKAETYEGTESIMVNKSDYKKYENLVPKINKQLGTSFVLSKESAPIDFGFLIVGKHFDLNFDFMELVNQVRKEHETKLAEELFK